MSKPIPTRSEESPGDLPAEEFRKLLHQAADWVADYRLNIEQQAISPQVRPGEVTNSLPSQMPEWPQPVEMIMADFERLIVPNLVHWGHPAFVGYFGSTTTGPGILGELMAATLNVSAMTWATSPAATEL
ncbi:MAG TPA: pyridoxal-dependent decarboxylase, partial [Pyrinomonadaceae bacterium]|nr:pyridoxal-dependent decarboxylase [Pyrinomonadaceae bacterium]